MARARKPEPPASHSDGAQSFARPRSGKRSRTRYRDPLWARLLVLFGALLMMASGGTVVAAKMVLNEVDDSLRKDDLLPSTRVSIKGPVNILLVGIDPRGDEDPRSDSIIIAHVPAAHDKVYLISVPRDARVNVPPFEPAGFEGARDQKINAAFTHGSRNGAGTAGGFALLARTISSISGITFQAGAIVNFDGFKALVGALGGVEMCIDQTVTSIHIGHDRNGRVARPFNIVNDRLYPIQGVRPVVYKPACRKLAPWEALDYVRQRDIIVNKDGTDGKGDYDRQRHQQQFVKAVFEQAVKQGLTNPLKLKSIINTAGKAFTVDLNNLSMETWLGSLGTVREVVMVKSNAGNYNSTTINGQSYEILSPDTLKLFQSVATDTVDTFLASHPDWISTS